MTAGALHKSQVHIEGEACRKFLRALTNYAIEDLVDREQPDSPTSEEGRALDRIIERYVRKDAQMWAKLFDISFYRENIPDQTAGHSIRRARLGPAYRPLDK